MKQATNAAIGMYFDFMYVHVLIILLVEGNFTRKIIQWNPS